MATVKGQKPNILPICKKIPSEGKKLIGQEANNLMKWQKEIDKGKKSIGEKADVLPVGEGGYEEANDLKENNPGKRKMAEGYCKNCCFAF